MTARSIFQKICPGCMITLPLDAHSCPCGHQFDHDDTDASLSSEEIRVKAEELYESYLAARAEQAAGRVMSAQAEFAREPGDPLKSRRVTDAIRESEEARAALSEQSARVRELKKDLPQPAPPPRSLPVPAAPKKLITLVKRAPAPVRPRVEAKAVMAVASGSITAAVRSKQTARKTMTAPVERKPVSTPAPAQPADILPPVQSRTPNMAFRQAQAARAEKILRAPKNAGAPVTGANVNGKSVSPPKADPAPSPAVPLLTKSAPRLLASDRKECPNCTANVENKDNRCRCGYEFPSSEQLIPGLRMSDEERAEFAKLFSLS